MATQSGSAYEVKASRAGSGNVEANTREAKAVYLVKFTDATAYSWEAENATGVPVWGAQLGTTGMYVVEKRGTPHPDNQKIWQVEVTYRNLKQTEGVIQPNPNPTQSTWSIVKSIGDYPSEVPVQKDATGKVVANVLGEPMNPPLTQVQHDAQIQINFVTTATSHGYYTSLALECVNSDAGTITIGANNYVFGVGTLYFKNWADKEVFVQNGTSSNVRASQFTYDFLWRADGWHEKRPNLSLMMAPNGTSGTLTNGQVKCCGIAGNCTDSAWLASNATTPGYTGALPEYVTEPRYLDADGKPIANGGSITLNDFTTKETANFFTGLLLLLKD